MFDIRDDIRNTLQQYSHNYLQAIVEIIAKYIAGTIFSILSITIFSFFIGLLVLGILLIFYDKTSYPVFDYLTKVLHDNFVYKFYYEYINSFYKSILNKFNLSSNISKSGYLAIINIVIATISFYITNILFILSLIYTNLKLTFLDFKPKSLFFRIILYTLYKCILYIFYPAMFISGVVSIIIAYYFYTLIKLVIYILVPLSIILSIISFFFGKIIFAGTGLTQLGDLGLVHGVVYFAHHIWTAIFYTAFISMFLNIQQLDSDNNQISKQLNKKDNENQKNIKLAGIEGENKFQNMLDDLCNKLNIRYISSGNMLYGKSWVGEIDFLIMMQNVGLIVVEVKNYTGEIICSSEDKWLRVKYDSYGNQVDTTYESNASIQVITTIKLLKNILNLHNINKWKIIPVVVFVNSKIKVLELEDNKAQTNVITIDKFENWLTSLPKDERQQFDEDSYNKISQAIQSAEDKYQNSDNEKVIAIRNNQKSESTLLGYANE
ncbi:MAG: hypothetical protein Kow0076_6360 [Francisella sp.]